MRDFGADPERILTARARVVSKPGKLAALLAEHKPTWVILDNLRTWCRSMQADTDNSSAAADAIDPIAEAIRECGYPVACTIVHNEARSKGVTSDPYAGRMRNSTVFEDAADWIIGCAHADGSTTTTITAGEKTRREIPTETLIIDLDADGHGTPSTGGGGADPFTVGTPVNPLDEKITGYLMAHPEGVSQKAVAVAVGGRKQTIVARLNLLAVRDTTDKLFRLKGVPAEVVPIGGGNTGTRGCSRLFRPMGTGAEQGCSRVPHLIGNTGREQGPGTRSSGNTQPWIGLLQAQKTPPTPPGGGQLDGENQAAVAKHVAKHAGCLRCNRTGFDGQGKPCSQDWYLTQRGEIQKRWADGQAPTDGADRCAICSRWDGKTIGYDDGSYTVKIPRGDDTCVRCQACRMARAAGQPAPDVRDHEACWTANEGTVH